MSGVLRSYCGDGEAHLAAAEADCNDANIVAVGQELWLD
jgi:hypothetical protein